jgi:hypothetical protein
VTEPIARIEAALARLGAEHEPPPGWEARVLAAATTRKRRPWWLYPIPIAVLTVVGLAVVLPMVHRDAGDRLEVALSYSRSGSAVYRDKAKANVGDTVHATAKGGGSYRALWIYRDNQLVTACPLRQPCQSAGGATSIDVVLSPVGHWVIVALASGAPITAPTGSYDTDVADVPAGTRVHQDPIAVE